MSPHVRFGLATTHSADEPKDADSGPHSPAEATAPSRGPTGLQLVGSGLYLWLTGFYHACALHRTTAFFKRSRVICLRTTQCFVLNVFIFLGSMAFIHLAVLPCTHWLLRARLGQDAGVAAEGAAEGGEEGAGGEAGAPVDDPLLAYLGPTLLWTYRLLWLYPVYLMSFGINFMWYGEIATEAYNAHLAITDAKAAPVPASRGIGRVVGENLYRGLLFAVFLLQVTLATRVPLIGPALYFVLLSWLYAYYCFDYKWSLAGWTLERRLHFFETHWSYFAGFGGPCTLAALLLPKMVGEAVMNALFPFFLLVAMGVDVPSATKNAAPLGRVPVFRFASAQTLALIRLFGPHERP